MTDTDNYKNYLNQDDEIDEDLLREDLQQLYAPHIQCEIALRLEHALECERELVNDDGTSTFLSDEEIAALRESFQQEISDEVEEEYEDKLKEVLEDTLRQFDEQMDSEREEAAGCEDDE
jgi:hypothetical protein